MATKQKQPAQNLFSVQLFQAKNTNALKRMGVPLSSNLNEVVAFPKSELDALKALKADLPDVNFQKLPLNCTTEMPVSRGMLIDVASAKVYLVSPSNGKNGNGASSNETIAAVEKMFPDLKALLSEKFNSEFVINAIDKTAESLKGLKLSKNGDLLVEAQQKSVSDFEKLVADIESIIGKMYEKGMTDSSIYRKLIVDLAYLQAMNGFINNSVKKVQSVRADLNKKYSSLQHRLDNITTAIEKTEPRTWLDKAGDFIKGLTGLGLVGTATFVAAKGELMAALTAISNIPNVIYAGTVLAAAMVGVTVYLSIDVWKALRQNYYIKKYENRMDRLVQKGIEYTRRNLKIVGFKATKEAAFSGYLEALQGEASAEYLAAAFQGDFDTINSIYDRQVDRMMGKRSISRFLRRIGEIFHKDHESKMNKKIGQEATDADGHFADIVRAAPEAGQHEQPAESPSSQ